MGGETIDPNVFRDLLLAIARIGCGIGALSAAIVGRFYRTTV